jgi:hypothetical protein
MKLNDYTELVAFLRKTVGNEKATLKLRMQAAVRLDDLYARREGLREKRAARAERSEARKLGYTVAPPQEKTDARSTVPEAAPELSEGDRERQSINAALGWVSKADSQR